MKDRKILVVRWLFWILALCIMVTIFLNSSKTATQSSEDSKDFSHGIFAVFLSDYDTLSQAQQNALISESQFAVRKGAHFAVYFALGVFVSAALKTYKRKILHIFLFAQGFCSLYAASDELHQLFVEGRAGRVSDVLLDSAGSATGIIAVLAITSIFILIKRRKNNVHR